MELTAMGFDPYGQGAQHAGTMVIEPTTNTDALDVYNAAGTGLLDVTPSATPANRLVQIINGGSLVGWSGNFSGQTYRLNAATGNLNIMHEAVQPATDGVTLKVLSSGAPLS